MKNGKPSQNGKEELRKAKNQNRMSRKSSNSKTHPESTPPNTLNASSSPTPPNTFNASPSS
jgi:hypothetical protein